jgi:hypothetical protein
MASLPFLCGLGEGILRPGVVELQESFEDDCCFSDLDCSIVQRLQHFAGNAHFRQYVLNLIADNIIFGAGGDLLSRNEKTSQLNPLVRMFQRLDKDDSGELDSGDLLVRPNSS